MATESTEKQPRKTKVTKAEKAKLEKVVDSLWERETYRVRVKLTAPLLGTVPESKQLFAAHIGKKQAVAMKKEGRSDEEIREELESTIEGITDIDPLEQGKTTFYKDARGYYLKAYYIRGYLKDTASILKQYGPLKQLKSKVSKFLFVEPDKIYIAKPNAVLEVIERPLRAEGPMGVRSCLARSDSLPAGTEFEFDLVSLQGVFDERLIKGLLEYGSFATGMGQWRSAGNGRFEVLNCQKLR